MECSLEKLEIKMKMERKLRIMKFLRLISFLVLRIDYSYGRGDEEYVIYRIKARLDKMAKCC